MRNLPTARAAHDSELLHVADDFLGQKCALTQHDVKIRHQMDVAEMGRGWPASIAPFLSCFP